jgi:hypothetical protein
MRNAECGIKEWVQCEQTVLRTFTPHSALRIPHFNQASPLVLRRPVMRSPGFHCPRFLSSSSRSNRFRTFRFPPKVAAARKLRCCDINQFPVVWSAFQSAPRIEASVVYSTFTRYCQCLFPVNARPKSGRMLKSRTLGLEFEVWSFSGCWRLEFGAFFTSLRLCVKPLPHA